MTTTQIKNIEYKDVLAKEMKFATALKLLPTEGNLVYEYNPFHNYRLTEISYIYNDMLYTPYGLFVELCGVSPVPYIPKIDGETDEPVTSPLYYIVDDDDSAYKFFQMFDDWNDLNSRAHIAVPEGKDDPILGEIGDLVDFDTTQLKFDLNHPVMLEPLYSYDNSVNLIINDGKNAPRLINSRFSATLRNRYQIVDRKGNNDTNIYDQGDLFDIDTSLYKRVTEIPTLTLTEIGVGGTLPVGNYFFYFRYTDADGNLTDFVAESGLVSLFIGTLPTISRTGWRDEDSHKLVRFMLKNIDSAYQYVLVYYTRATADVDENASTAAYRIEQKFIVNTECNCDIVITGYETTTQVAIEEINPAYLIASSIEAQALCLNMLFIGNITKPNVPYEDLADCALRFLPYITKKEYGCKLSSGYAVLSTSMGYYDPEYIYSTVGYWNHEYYRFGVVFILSDGTLTRVFNVRGAEKLEEENNWSYIPLFNDEDKTLRNYIAVDEQSFLLIKDNDAYDISDLSFSSKGLENAKGTISINMPIVEGEAMLVYGINFKIDQEVLDYLREEYNIKGFFIVRQKRIPTILALALTIGVDTESNTPVLPVEPETYGAKLDFISEKFLDTDKNLTHTLEPRIYRFSKPSIVRTLAAICPEYDVDLPYFNQLFTGDEFTVVDSDMQPENPYFDRADRHLYITQDQYVANNNIGTYDARIVGVWDNVKLMGIGDDLFTARAGEAEEAFRFEYLEKENKVEDATNMVRGSFGPYIALSGLSLAGKLIDIKIPGFSQISEEDLFKIRYNDKNSFYAISERIDINKLDQWMDSSVQTYGVDETDSESTKWNVTYYSFIKGLYRGDCYICQFSHRFNRNFLDPSAPLNDEIVDATCWEEHYTLDDDGTLDYEEFQDVNLGDVNAIKLGLWTTFTVRSTKNLNIRSTDDSWVDEMAMTGHARGYYPYYSLIADGAYKTPEALCYNKGFERSVSERYNFEEADVPFIKNDFSNRIAYSDIHVNDAFKNGFRVFLASHYTDYSKEYGAVIKLVEFNGSLVCVFEHAVGLIPVNADALKAEQQSGEVYVSANKVIPKSVLVLTHTYGSQWRDSVIKTATAVYGVDTVARKIWQVTAQGIAVISDNRVSEFLNNNISLTEREIEPIIGVRNVKAHYNKFKEDVMFTFYDNLYGFEEKVWNLCYNETALLFITFYSWVPSFSENIYNQYFSFDRNTSKWIAKLGISHSDNAFADGVTLSNNIITEEAALSDDGWRVLLNLSNRTLPTGENISVQISYSLERDNYGNYLLFEIEEPTESDPNWYLVFKGNIKEYPDEDQKEERYKDILSELYDRDDNGNIKKDDRGRRIWLDQELQKNPDKIVRLLNIRANIQVSYDGTDYKELADAYCEGFINTTFVDAGYYESVVAVIPEYNMLFLTTDFWKHGQAGIIDIADTINPTYWYGKQHPFEFEFIVNDKINLHKIFDSLLIIANNAEPESFHYEIVGDCFSFANDKKNMYIRQEATKELYQYNGFDVTYDHDYTELDQQLRPSGIDGVYDRSTLMPLYYSRLDTINEIEDYYHLKDNVDTKDFANRSGAEIVKYHNLDEYRLWEHTKAVDIRDEGRLRGNMNYQEDIWRVLINPLNIVQANEPKWPNGLVPVEIGLSPLPDDILQKGLIDIPDGFYSPDDKEDEGRHIVNWNWGDNQVDEVKLKDKWIKIRVRYKGDKLAIIHSIITLYSISSS